MELLGATSPQPHLGREGTPKSWPRPRRGRVGLTRHDPK